MAQTQPLKGYLSDGENKEMVSFSELLFPFVRVGTLTQQFTRYGGGSRLQSQVRQEDPGAFQTSLPYIVSSQQPVL